MTVAMYLSRSHLLNQPNVAILLEAPNKQSGFACLLLLAALAKLADGP